MAFRDGATLARIERDVIAAVFRRGPIPCGDAIADDPEEWETQAYPSPLRSPCACDGTGPSGEDEVALMIPPWCAAEGCAVLATGTIALTVEDGSAFEIYVPLCGRHLARYVMHNSAEVD